MGTITNLGAKQTNVGNAGNQQRQRSQLTSFLACRYFRVPVRLRQRVGEVTWEVTPIPTGMSSPLTTIRSIG
jgi:hypothetical protein